MLTIDFLLSSKGFFSVWLPLIFIALVFFLSVFTAIKITNKTD